MRVCVVSPAGNARFGDKFSWIADGFRQAGCATTRAHNLDDLRLQALETDLIVLSHYNAGLNDNSLLDLMGGVEPRILDGLTGKTNTPARTVLPPVVQVWWDLIYRDPKKTLAEQELFKSFSPLMRACRMVFVKERALIHEYRELGVNAHWLDQGCPEYMPACEHHKDTEWDVLVFGSTDRPQRMQDANLLRKNGFRVAWAGRPGRKRMPDGITILPWTTPHELPSLVSRAACVLSVDFRQDVDGYCSDRVWLSAGMGAVVLHRLGAYTPKAGILGYRDDSELLGLATEWCPNHSARQALGTKARIGVMHQRTYKNVALDMLRAVFKPGLLEQNFVAASDFSG